MSLTIGDKVRVVDRRDGAIVMRGEIERIGDGEVTVAGRFEQSAFAGGTDYNKQTIRVPVASVELDQ